MKYSMSLMFFFEEFRLFLIFIKNENHPSYLCGDYNIDLLKIKIKNHFNNYFEELVTNGFFLKLLYQQE